MLTEIQLYIIFLPLPADFPGRRETDQAAGSGPRDTCSVPALYSWRCPGQTYSLSHSQSPAHSGYKQESLKSHICQAFCNKVQQAKEKGDLWTFQPF